MEISSLAYSNIYKLPLLQGAHSCDPKGQPLEQTVAVQPTSEIFKETRGHSDLTDPFENQGTTGNCG